MKGLVESDVLHCIGESHCLRFSDLCWFDGGRALQTRVHFLMHVEATNFTGEGGLHPDVAATLLGAGLCKEATNAAGETEITAVHRGTTFDDRVLAARHAALADRSLVPPALLWFAGDKEVHSLAVELGPDVDFELPGHRGELARGAVRLLHEDVEAAMEHRLQPFFAGLDGLVTAGFTRSLVHALAPRCADPARVARWLGGAIIPTALRTKLALLANRAIARCCARLGLAFVDPWGDVALGDVLDPRFDLDGVHLNRAATERTLPRIVEALRRCGDGGVNDKQYELLAELAVSRDAEATKEARALAVHGRAVAATRFVVEAASWSQDLHAQGFREILAEGWAAEVGVVLASRVPFGSPSRIANEAARAVRSAVLALGAVAVRVRDAHGGTAELALEPGSVLLFDPTRVTVGVREASEASVVHVLALARLPEEEPRTLETSGGWPADPFRVEGTVVADGARGAITVRRWREVAGRTIVLPRPESAAALAPTA